MRVFAAILLCNLAMPAFAGCHPSYDARDFCVPDGWPHSRASGEPDCSFDGSGQGDNPVVGNNVRVLPGRKDVYRLDRDCDGLACEHPPKMDGTCPGVYRSLS